MPRSSAAKVLAAFFALVGVQVLWAATQGRFEWPSLAVWALVGLLYLLTQGIGGDKLSFAQKLRASLVATWGAVTLGIGFATYMTLRVANEPDSEGREVVGFAVLFGGFALIGMVMAIPYTLQLRRLIRREEQQHSQ